MVSTINKMYHKVVDKNYNAKMSKAPHYIGKIEVISNKWILLAINI